MSNQTNKFIWVDLVVSIVILWGVGLLINNWLVAIIIGIVYGGISWILYASDNNRGYSDDKIMLSLLWPFLFVASSDYREIFLEVPLNNT